MSRVKDLWFVQRNGQRVPTTRHGRGKRWLAVWSDDAGRERTRACDTKAQAERVARNSAVDTERGDWLDPDAGRITLGKYAEAWLERQVIAPSTRESYTAVIETRLGLLADQSLRSIRPSDVQAQVKALSTRLAPRTVRHARGVLATILNSAVADGLIRGNPAASSTVKSPKVPSSKVTVWTAEQVGAVADALPERYAVAAALMAGAGLRQGEAFGLAVGDIDFLRRVIHVRRQVAIVGARLVFSPPKHDSIRDVPIPEHLVDELAAHLAAFPAHDVTLPWRSPDGEVQTHALVLSSGYGDKPVNRKYFNPSIWKPALEKAGIETSRENGCHVLRHTYASTLLGAGIGVPAVAAWLGHRDPGFTLRVYGHLLPDDEERSRAALATLSRFSRGTETEQGGVSEAQ